MAWIREGPEYEKVRLALSKWNQPDFIIWVYNTAQRWVEENLDAARFSPSRLNQMAYEHVARGDRVRAMDDHQEDNFPVKRWYAVELMCGDKRVFYKFKFLPNNRPGLQVVSVHRPSS
jgi:hypothetical protein